MRIYFSIVYRCEIKTQYLIYFGCIFSAHFFSQHFPLFRNCYIPLQVYPGLLLALKVAETVGAMTDSVSCPGTLWQMIGLRIDPATHLYLTDIIDCPIRLHFKKDVVISECVCLLGVETKHIILRV